MTMQVTPTEVLSRARRIRYSPERFDSHESRRGFVWGYMTGVFTAIFFFLMLAIPTGAGIYAFSHSSEYSSIKIVKVQDVPSYSDTFNR